MNNHDLLSQWLGESPENRLAFLEEGLILDATETIFKAMEKRGMTKAALAEQLGSSKAHVTQLLNGSRNMTLRTFARIAFSLDMAPSVELEDLTCFVQSEGLVEQGRQPSTEAWDWKIIETSPRKPKAPSVVIEEASADWTGFDRLKAA